MIVKIKVINNEDGWVNYWNIDWFEERLQLMKENLDYFFNYNELRTDNDPFWDPKEMILQGRGICLIKNNIYRFSLE